MPFTLLGLNPENPDDIQEPRISRARVVSEEEMEQYYRELSDYMEAVPGYSFQKDVWSWRPLWVFICIKGDDILSDEDMKKGQYNSGHCLRITKAKKIASRLRWLHKEGKIKKYEKIYVKKNESLPDKKCTTCNGVGRMWCNYCHGKGWVRPFETRYQFRTENVLEFERFCVKSGGFQIRFDAN